MEDRDFPDLVWQYSDKRVSPTVRAWLEANFAHLAPAHTTFISLEISTPHTLMNIRPILSSKENSHAVDGWWLDKNQLTHSHQLQLAARIYWLANIYSHPGGRTCNLLPPATASSSPLAVSLCSPPKPMCPPQGCWRHRPIFSSLVDEAEVSCNLHHKLRSILCILCEI
jgi:hypothetical protein